MTVEQLNAQDANTVQAQLLPLFATPVLRGFWPDSDALNAELKRVILARMQKTHGVVQSNRGGWHSESDLQTWPEECAQVMIGRINYLIREAVRQTVPNAAEEHLTGWKITAWANVNSQGSYNKPHSHDGFGNIWSGFYYVDTGKTPEKQDVGGCTKFQDRSGAPKEILQNPDPYEREVTVNPTGGLMLMFPGRLFHYVEPYHGDQVRITIAFNLKHPGFLIPYYEGMQEQSWMWTNFRGLMIVPSKVPEKLRAVGILLKKLGSRKPPATSWPSHFKASLDQATAEASAAADQNWGRITTSQAGRQ
jgi:uncharacterized protein (TIGR02466 family)